MSITFAFLHHKGELTLQGARRLQVIDALYGASAGVVLVVGLLRVFYFEKGASYYFHSAPFIAKLSLFVVVGLLSIYPTLMFRRLGKAAKLGQQPAMTAVSLRNVRRVVHVQLAGIVLILLCAAMMGRGVGVW